MRKLSWGIFIFLVVVSCTSKNGLKPQTGFIDVTGGKVWYKIIGEGNKIPVVLLHGGPGATSYYLNPLSDLGKERPVIFFDQLGCGRSPQNLDSSLMTIESFVEQLEQLRTTLDIKEFYLYGHSWGTMLGVDYYLKYPKAVKAMILGSPCLSAKLWTQDADSLLTTLPDSIQQAIQSNEQKGTFHAPEYLDAVNVYYKNFVLRTSTPDGDSAMSQFGTQVYEYMWGPSEFTALGALKDYDQTDRLNEIKVPVLFMAGEFDEARPSTVRYYQSLVSGATFVLIKDAGHFTMLDHPKQNIEAIREFLRAIEGN